MHAAFVAVVVDTPETARLPFDRARDLQEAIDDAVDLGADVVRIEAPDERGRPGAGRPRPAGDAHRACRTASAGGLGRMRRRPLAEQLIERLPDVEVHLVAGTPKAPRT